MKNIFTTLALIASITTWAQLPNGSTAPDFTLTDINGNTFHLYEYLDQGKTVYIDFFAAHCPTCWTYHNQGHIENLYTQYGPDGSVNQAVVVVAIEHDPNNGLNELTGVSGSTQGNWLEGTTHPVINPEGAERTAIIAGYAANFYPMVYAICPDRSTTLVGPQNTATLYQEALDCASTVGTTELIEGDQIICRYNSDKAMLEVTNATSEMTLEIMDATGRIVINTPLTDSFTQIKLSSDMRGIFFCRFISNNETKEVKRILVN
jgi:thiol-disulfide isomerase/thioredoxin